MSDGTSAIDWAAHADGVRRLARGLVGDDAADDVAQEALLLALEKGPSRERLGEWLRAASRNVAMRFGRSARRRATRERRAARREAEPSAADAVMRVAEQSRLLSAVMRLPGPQRTAIVLRFFEDLPPREIAARLDVPVETVRTRVKRGLAALRDELRETHGGDDHEWRVALAPLLALEAKRPALAIGGLVMATKAKIAAVAIAVLLVVLGLWRFAGSHTEREVASPPRASATTTRSTATTTRSTATLEPPRTAPERAAVASTESDTPTSSGWHIAGHVVDESGRPITGARLRLGSPVAFCETAGEPVARSDDAGRFDVVAPADARIARVVAEADGRRLDWCDVLASRPREVELRLEAVRTLHFVVRDAETGDPIAGVALDSLVTRRGVVLRSRALSDADGRAAIADPGLPDYWDLTRLRFSKRGWEPAVRDGAWIHLHRGTAERPAEIDLRPGEDLVVEVADASTGEPAAGAHVTGWSGRDGGMPFGAGSSRASIGMASLGDAITGDDGIATLPAATPNEPACVVARADGKFGLACSTARPRTCRVTLSPTRVVRGQVVDENGEPVAGARVETTMLSLLGDDDHPPGSPLPTIPSAAEEELSTRTDANGRFVFESLPRLSDCPFSITASIARRAGAVRLESAASEVDVTIRLSPAEPSFDVRVRDDSGSPVEGALVRFALLYPGDRTDANGVARLDRSLPPASFPRTLVVEAPGFAASRTAIAHYPDSGVPLDVTLERENALEGTVVDDRERPANAHVRVVSMDMDPSQIPSIGLDDARLLGECEANDDGRFRVDGLSAGPWRVQAWQIRTYDSVFSLPSEARASEPVVLRLASPDRPTGTSRLEGAVFDGSGRRVTRYWIRLRQEKRLIAAHTAAWHFVFDDVPSGDYSVEITLPDASETTRTPITVREGEDQLGLRFALAEWATLAGRLSAEAGVDLADVEVEAIDAEHGFSRGAARTDAHGVFAISKLPAGEYVLRASARGDAMSSVQVCDGRFAVGDGSRVERTFAVAPAARVVIVVDDERFASDDERERQPFLATSQRSQFTLVELRDAAGRRCSVDEVRRGRHTLGAALLPGDYVLYVTSPKFNPMEVAIRVAGPDDVPVRLDFPTDRH
jgi:RNA polymerase sigma factor (sigma-70 family)